MAKKAGSELVRSLDALLKEKSVLEAREKNLIASLSDLVGKMGYRIVADRGRDAAAPARREERSASRPQTARAPRRPRAAGQRQGRRMTAAMRKAASERMKAYWAKRRRRPKPKRRG